MTSGVNKGRHWQLWSLAAGLAVVVATVTVLPILPATAAGPNPIAVTPFGGYNAALTRAPYVTDLTQTAADVSWATTSPTPGSLQWGPLGNCTANKTAVPGSLPLSQPPAGTPTSVTAPAFSVVSGINEYQSTVVLSGLSPSTTYCYRPLSSTSADLLGTNPSQSFTTLAPATSSSPLTFDVVGDYGETLYSSTTPFANNLNTDQAAIDSLIGSSGAKFVVNAGDIGYNNGSQANYGDLVNGGSQISDIFGPSYWPQTGGLPQYASEGNHGQNTTGLRSWPESNIAAASSGVYAYDSYPALAQDGTNAGTYPDAWYAVSDGNTRVYVLDSAWADGSNAGTATGAACTNAGEAACPGYQIDHDVHWTSTSPEYKWLAADLAAHPGAVKMAVWHYPLRSDQSSQDSDVYLQNSASNPSASSSLEALLSANGVKVAFNGHAHGYQRIAPSASGTVTNYVTGGGGSILQPVSTSGACTAFKSSGSIYAIGWSPTSNTGTACGSAPAPQSAAQVYNFLKVTVNGGTVTVTPINAAGQSFDVQSYTYSTTPATVIDSSPPALTNSTTAAVSFHSTAGASTFTCSLDAAPATSCSSPITYTGLSQGAHSVTVTGAAATPATANWTVNTSPPTTPTNVLGSAPSSTQVSLTWSPSSDTTGVTGYNVYRNGVLITATPVTTTSYTDTAASPGATYQYTVVALDGAGNASSPGGPTTVTTPTGPSGPGFVQTAGSSTTTVTLPVASTPGDLLVLSASVLTGASHPITAVSDGKNTWTKVGAYDVSGSNSDGEMWYAANAASVSAVTVTTGATTVSLRLNEFNGVATTSPFVDASSGSAGSSTSATSGTATAVGANDLAVGFIAGHSTSQAISITSAGFTAQTQQNTTTPSTTSVETGYKDLSAAGAQTFAGSFPSTMYWADGIALFKAGAAAPPPGDFTIADSPTSQTVTAGGTASSTVSTTTVGTAQLVALSATGLPTGASVSFSPQTVTAGGASSTMTVTTSPSTPGGAYPITVTGAGTSATHTTTFTLTVDTAPTITSGGSASFTQGTAGTFTVTASGFPTATLSEAGGLPANVSFVDNGGGSATLSGTPPLGSAASYPITITAANGITPNATQSFTLNTPAPPSDFSISDSPTAGSVAAGSSTTSTISTAITAGTAQSVTLSATGTPSGAAVSFSPPSVTAGQSSTMTVSTSGSTPVATTSITVTGTGTTTHSTPFGLTVTSAPSAPTITSAASTAFTQGVAGTFTVSATGTPTAALSESGGLPTGVTFTDNHNGTATLSGTPALGSAASYGITITAANGVVPNATQSFTLNVNPPPSDFSISDSPTSATIAAGTSPTSTITTAVTSGSAESVSLSSSGAPTGVLVSFSPQVITSGQTSTMTVSTTTATAPTTATITVTGTSGATIHSTSYGLTVTSAPSDFSIAASPTSATVSAGAATSSTISTTVTSGPAGSVSLSSTGAPTGVLVSFSPQVITAGQSSTMTVSTSSTTPVATTNITVTGTGSTTHSTSFGLNVTAAAAAPSFVQSTGATETATSTSLIGTFTKATTTGDLLVLSAGEYTGATNHITSVTDSAGNTWNRVTAVDVSGHNSDGEMWYVAGAASVTSVTVHLATAATLAASVQEFAGVATSAALDTSASTSNTGTAAASGSATPSVANELAVGFVTGHNNAEAVTVTASGFTAQAQQTSSTGTIASVVTGYRVLGSPAAQSFTGSFGTAMYWAAGVAFFKPV